MGKSILIRTATINDLDILMEFEQGVISAERPLDSTLKDEQIQYYNLIELITSPLAELLIAECGHQLIGCGYAKIRHAKPYFKHEWYAYLGFMFVVPDFRGRGVNQMIMEKLKDWVRSKDITEMRLKVYEENTGAIRAYEKAGFTKHMVEMRMNLDE